MPTKNFASVVLIAGGLCSAPGGAFAQDADANVGVWPMKTIGQATPTGPVTSLIRFGQAMTMPCRVPPKWEAICLVHLNGVSKAQAQPTAIYGVVTGEPQAPSDIV